MENRIQDSQEWHCEHALMVARAAGLCGHPVQLDEDSQEATAL